MKLATDYTMAFLLLLKDAFPAVPFSLASLSIHSRGRLLAAYIDPDVGGSYTGRDSFRNNTLINGNFEAVAIASDVDICDEEIDTVGPGTLGDIMAVPATAGTQNNNCTTASQTALIDGLVTKEGGELNKKFGCHFSPMERIALTANGNLQRIFSSYYDAPIHVHIDSCTRRTAKSAGPIDLTTTRLDRFLFHFEPDDAVWDRVVHLHVYEQTLCKATSVIHVRSPMCIQLIEEGTVGLGQLFRHLNKLPTFKLLDAGRTDISDFTNSCGRDNFHGGMWRTYELQSDEVTCLIHEEFHCNAWDIFTTDRVPFRPIL